MSLLKKTDRMDIYLEESRGIILVREKWKYNWLNAMGTSHWDYFHRRDFHEKADRIIWKTWSNRYKLRTKGTSDLAKKFSHHSLVVNFDIQWVFENAHWEVDVKKIRPNGISPTSEVKWNERKIILDTKDTQLTYKGSYNGNNFYQFPVSHEFGHTIGNSFYAMKEIGKNTRGDEYRTENFLNGGFRFDFESVMNVGNHLRTRHIEYILYQLNQSLSNTSFYLSSL